MHVAQNVVAANMLSPAPSASRLIASLLLLAPAPIQRRIDDPIMPRATAKRRPFRLPSLRAARSENHPPTGARAAIAMYGVDPQSPPWAMLRCRTRTR